MCGNVRAVGKGGPSRARDGRGYRRARVERARSRMPQRRGPVATEDDVSLAVESADTNTRQFRDRMACWLVVGRLVR